MASCFFLTLTLIASLNNHPHKFPCSGMLLLHPSREGIKSPFCHLLHFDAWVQT